MSHGTLALLLLLESHVTGGAQPEGAVANPLAKTPTSGPSAATAGGLRGRFPVSLDLRGSKLTGFYQECEEAFDKLVALVEAHAPATPGAAGAADTSAGASESVEAELAAGFGAGESPAIASPQMAEVELGVEEDKAGATAGAPTPPSHRIAVIDLNEASGLTQMQLKSLHAACVRVAGSGEAVSAPVLNYDGKIYAPSRCSLM
mmetsp:Transcript_43543/g.98419  ORF Transcript_43543/g.98419 Transcript_43543/m.98419 type:complete len:204 (-) Transcript_43543:194-805(-)